MQAESKLIFATVISVQCKHKYERHCERHKMNEFKDINFALAGVAQWTERWPVNQRVTGLIPGQGTCLGCGPDPQ